VLFAKYEKLTIMVAVLYATPSHCIAPKFGPDFEEMMIISDNLKFRAPYEDNSIQLDLRFSQ
jgi:hypothetical protein